MFKSPFDLRQYLRVGLLAALNALAPDSPDLLPELRGVLARADVDQQVAEDGNLNVDVQDDLKASSSLYYEASEICFLFSGKIVGPEAKNHNHEIEL